MNSTNYYFSQPSNFKSMPSFSNDCSTSSLVVLNTSESKLSKSALAFLPGVHPKALERLLIQAAILFLVAAENFARLKNALAVETCLQSGVGKLRFGPQKYL